LSSMNFCCTDDPNQVRHRHHFPYRELIASHSIAPLLQWARLARWPENPLKNERLFFGILLKGKELHVLKPLN